MPPTPPPAVLYAQSPDLHELEEQVWKLKKFPMPPAFEWSADFPDHPAMTDLKFKFDEMRFSYAPEIARLAQEAMLFAQAKPGAPSPPAAPAPAIAPRAKFELSRSRDSEDRLYRRGASYLDRKEWQNAVDAFSDVINAAGTRVDGALYWKAYALNRLGRRDDALAALAELRKSHPSSRWLNDAKALEAEVRQASGQGISPERETDEDLKLFAINSLMHSDPERAVPLLEKIVTTSTSPKLKERALFVLAQSNVTRAREVVVQVAKGDGNPDIQVKAVEYLGIHGGPDNRKILASIYSGNADTPVKRQILRAFMVAGDREALLRAAKGEPNADLRREAINALGAMDAEPELSQLYAAEVAAEVRESIINAMAMGRSSDRLMELARAEKDARLRKTAVERLGHSKRNQQTADALVAMYGSEPDKGVKQAISRALFHQGNGKALVDIARKETDPQLKREIVQQLSMTKSKEGADYFMELLNK